MINGKSFFDQPIRTYDNIMITYDNIWAIATDKGNDYITSCLLDYVYFKNYYKLIAIDLREQQELVADPKAMQQLILQ